MKISKILIAGVYATIFLFMLVSCQKLDRPELGEVIRDPDPPAYNPLKSYWTFENNVNDSGENKLTGTPVNVSYVPGINGQAIRFGNNGYVLFQAIGDTVRYPNEFIGLPADTLSNPGSFTLSFWMNGTGPVTGGAQGLFAISNKNEFWGNLEVFLENNDNGAEGFLKIHMFNAGVAAGNGEEWTEVKIPNMLNKWTHIAITYDAGTSGLSIYADGAPTAIANKTLGGGSYGKLRFNNFNGFVIGTYQFQTTPSLTNHGPETWAKSFNGAMDQVRLYNRGLSGAEIAELFNSKN